MSAQKKTKPTAEPESTGFAVDQIRQALGCAPDEDVLDKAKATVNHLALVKTALDKSERLRDEDFRGLVDVLRSYGLPVGDALDPSKVVELTKRALAGLDERISEACDILDVPENKRGLEAMMTNLRQKYAGLERQNDYLRREIMDAKRILGIDDPDGLLLDEQGVLMGDMMTAWELAKQIVWEGLHTRPDNLPDTCRKLVQLVTEQRDRMRAAVGNLALHTSCTEIEDATLDVRDKLEAAEERLEALENERLQFLADTHPGDNNEALRILLALMHRVATGKVSINHRV